MKARKGAIPVPSPAITIGWVSRGGNVITEGFTETKQEKVLKKVLKVIVGFWTIRDLSNNRIFKILGFDFLNFSYFSRLVFSVNEGPEITSLLKWQVVATVARYPKCHSSI